MRPRLAGLVALLASLLVGCSRTGSGTYDGSCATDPAYRSEVAVLDGSTGVPVWKRTLPHPREDAPEVVDGAVLLRGCGAVVLDVADGHRLHRLPADEESRLVGLVDGHVVTSRDGDVDAVPLRGGGGFSGGSTPPWDAVVAGGDLLLAVGTDVTAFDLSAGTERWRSELPTSGRLTATAAPGSLLIRTGDGSLCRVDPATGSVRWRVVPPAGTEVAYEEVLAVGTTAFVAVRGGAVVGMDLATGSELWRRTDLRLDAHRRWAAAGDVVTVPTGDAVAGLDLRTGRVLWRLATESWAPVAAGGSFVLDDALSAVGVDPRDGTVLWRRATTHRPLLGADPRRDEVVVLDSRPVPHGMDDCC